MPLPHALMLFVANGRDNNNALNDYFIRPRMRGRFATYPIVSRGKLASTLAKISIFVCLSTFGFIDDRFGGIIDGNKGGNVGTSSQLV
jgi:hypothetical protein